MNAITLPSELAAWAEAEVASGRAPSVEALTIGVLADYRRRWAELRASLDDAAQESDRLGWRPAEDVFDKALARYTGPD